MFRAVFRFELTDVFYYRSNAGGKLIVKIGVLEHLEPFFDMCDFGVCFFLLGSDFSYRLIDGRPKKKVGSVWSRFLVMVEKEDAFFYVCLVFFIALYCWGR